MRKICLITLLIAMSLFVLTGCSGVADEKKIQSDLKSYSKSDLLHEDEKIDKVEIEKRETDKEQKVDTVWCSIITKDMSISYEKKAVLTYNFSDKSKWVLEDVSMNDSDKWIKTPINGISEKDIPNSLDGKSVTVDGEVWSIEANEVTGISIDKQDTDIEKKTDMLTVTLTLSSAVKEATGQVAICYNFDNGWEIDSVSEEKEFKATIKPEVALNITNDDLIAEIVKQEFQIGMPDEGEEISFYNTSDLQTITMDKSEISDFKIESQKSTSKGSYQTYSCSCTLSKAHGVFSIDAEIQYYYVGTDGWIIQPIRITPKLTSVNILGEWKGTYNGAPYDGDSTLNISNVDADGTITAVYSYYPSTVDKYSQPGSYNVSGKLDMTTLHMTLVAGEWVTQPEKPLSISKVDISAILYINDSKIQGTAQEGDVFTVMQ
ncbi:MAG: hypothetical protein PHS82_14485 [Lachnospiraceae bacterium]|nr:hypothetical protein [Lachnospiraceae bacterium]